MTAKNDEFVWNTQSFSLDKKNNNFDLFSYQKNHFLSGACFQAGNFDIFFSVRRHCKQKQIFIYRKIISSEKTEIKIN